MGLRTIDEEAPVDHAEREYERMTDELAARHAGLVTREEVAAIVADSREQPTATASVTTFVPVLTQRFARTGSPPSCGSEEVRRRG